MIPTFLVIPFMILQDNMNYEIDACASTLLINMSNQIPNAFMPKEYFSALSSELRKSWSKILNSIKTVMLRSRTANINESDNNHDKKNQNSKNVET